MTRDDVIRLAKEAGCINPSPYTAPWEHEQLALERFAHLVIADFLRRTGQYVTNDASREAALEQAKAEEREACAKACMDEARKWPYPSHGNAAASMCAKMIFDMRQK